MHRPLLLTTALVTVWLVAAAAWTPLPQRQTRPPRSSGTKPPPAVDPGGGSLGMRPPIGPARPEFAKEFDAACAKSASAAANLLRSHIIYLDRTDRAVMLNRITYQMLRQKEAVPLAELRRLRADWDSFGAGSDPILAIELEAVESAAERVLLTEILQLAATGDFSAAAAQLDTLAVPYYLPTAAVHALPNLRTALHRAALAQTMQTALHANNSIPSDIRKLVAHINPEAIPADIRSAIDAWGVLLDTADLFAAAASDRSRFTINDWNRRLTDVQRAAGDGVAGKLRAEAAAALFLANRPADAAKLLTADTDPSHARAIRADLQAIVLGRGEITNPQVAAFVAADAKSPPASVAAVLPPELLKNWKPPARRPGPTTLELAINDTQQRLKKAIATEFNAATTVVSAAADRIRRLVATDTGMNEFLDKVTAVRGKPLTPVESDIARVAGHRGLTVAETIGVLVAEADRPASVARLVAIVPVFTSPVEFVARVELAGRAPATFAPHPATGHKLTAAPNRARIRAAVRAVLETQAAKIAAALPVEPLDPAALENRVATRLEVAPGSLPPVELVQALLDVCSHWAVDHRQLSNAWEVLTGLLAEMEPDTDDTNLKELWSAAQLRRLTIHQERKRREAGLTIACRLFGEYGPVAEPARGWLSEQTGAKPWAQAANAALKQIDGK